MIGKRLEEMAVAMREMFPGKTCSVGVSGSKTLTLEIHNCNHDSATAIMREIGIGKRSKMIIQDWHVLQGNTEAGLHVTCYCSGLPPTCHLEIYTEKIPKTQTVDTGEFVEVTRTKVVCSGSEKE